MTQNITKYYIPQNLNISKGKIYNMYLNKVTNLDLSQIITPKDVTLNGILQPNKQVLTEQQPTTSTNTITLSKEDYTELLSLADNTTKLYNQSQELVKKLTKGRPS